jgi:hypothetical protein
VDKQFPGGGFSLTIKNIREMSNGELSALARQKAGAGASKAVIKRIYTNLLKERDEAKKKRNMWGYGE